MHYYLPQDIGLRWADALGPVKDPRVFDWRDALDRLQGGQADAHRGRARAHAAARASSSLAVYPIIRTARWGAPWTSAGAQALGAVAARARPRPAPVAHAGRRP